MQIVAIVWHPNAQWEALSNAEKLTYLKSLDGYINAGRAAGLVVLGWSRIDATVPRSPPEGYIGVFGVEDAARAHEFEKLVGEADWYRYFDSRNISVCLEGSTEAAPHRIYAKLLDVPLV
ncbi:MAG: hypothetical protein RLW62_15135 [Gammaproteobacteria bacterium]